MTELTLEESLSMFMAKIAKRHDENTNLIKELRASTYFALRNQKALIKALEIQTISTSVKADKPLIRHIDASQYAVSNLQNRNLFSKSKKTTLPSSSHLNDDHWDELKETDGEKDLEAHYTNAKPLGKALPRKEKDPGSFTLPFFINNMCFNKALADLGASVSVMPYSTYTTLRLGDLIPSKLIVELADKTVKRPKGIVENVLVDFRTWLGISIRDDSDEYYGFRWSNLFILEGLGRLLYQTIISRLRLERRIVLAVASSGIASLLLPAGRTSHSRFIISLDLMENSTCGIKQNTQLAELMQEVQLIIWDEAPMTQRYAFEALDIMLRDILGFKNTEKRNQIFGGMTVLLGGDFRQILPVISKAKRPKIVQACINKSELINRWVLAVGDDTLPAKIKEGEDEPTWIDIPEKFLIKSLDSPIQQIVTKTYPDFTSRQTDDEYLKEREIPTLRNDDVEAINRFMFKQLSGEPVTYHSADEICKASTDNIDQHQLYPIEFLNSLNFPGMPPHALCLKKNY
ncbi:ATP-dependent DNA helicase PIF1-like protein [Tanacetum coccineum]